MQSYTTRFHDLSDTRLLELSLLIDSTPVYVLADISFTLSNAWQDNETGASDYNSLIHHVVPHESYMMHEGEATNVFLLDDNLIALKVAAYDWLNDHAWSLLNRE